MKRRTETGLSRTYIKSHPSDCHRKSNQSRPQGNPQSSSFKQLQQQSVHRLVSATDRDGRGLTVHVTLQSADTWPVKKVINEWDLLQLLHIASQLNVVKSIWHQPVLSPEQNCEKKTKYQHVNNKSQLWYYCTAAKR